MHVILLENYPSLGYVGDRVQVRNGFARNFLIPRGIALEASDLNARQLKHRLQGVQAKRSRLKGEAEAIAQKLAGLTLDFSLKSSDRGKTFGAVTLSDIEVAFRRHEVVVDRRQIRISEPLKRAGEFKVTVKLHPEVAVAVPVRISVETPLAAKEETPAPKGRRGKRGQPAGETSEAAQQEASASAPKDAAESPPKKARKKTRKKADTNSDEE